MTARKINGAWWVDFRYDRERIRRKSLVNTRRGAQEYERSLRLQLLHGTYQKQEGGGKKETPLLSEFASDFIEHYAKVHNKPSEVLSKEGNLDRYLLPVLGKTPLDKIRSGEIDKLAAWMLKKKLAKKTVNNALGTLGKLLRYAEENELIVKAPKVRKLATPIPEFDFLTFEEAEGLVEASGYNPEWYAMIFFTLRTGFRYGELCELRWSDVDLVVGKVVVRRSYVRGHIGTPKSGRNREIPLSEETVAFLKKHRHLKGELVFCKDDGGRHIHRRAYTAIKRCAKRAGLRSIGWHVLRHTFASHLVMKGVSLKAVQELLGHSTMDMTMRYAHLSPAVKRDAVSLLDGRSGKSGHYMGIGENSEAQKLKSPCNCKGLY